MKVFDYIYYRIYKFFQNRSDNVSETTASVLLSLMQFLALIDLMFLLQMFYNFTIPPKWFFAPILIFIMALNWYRYEREFEIEKYDQHWQNEAKDKKSKNGWFLVFYLFIAFLFPVLYGVFKHNLNMFLVK